MLWIGLGLRGKPGLRFKGRGRKESREEILGFVRYKGSRAKLATKAKGEMEQKLLRGEEKESKNRRAIEASFIESRGDGNT